jgi:hypothetical protein
VKLFQTISDPAASIEIFDHLRRTFDKDGITDTGMFLCTVGSLGGFASQQAVWKACIEPNGRDPGDFLVQVGTKSGEVFYFGEAINLFLSAVRDGTFSFYSMVAGSVPDAGPATLPDLTEIFRHVAGTCGGSEFWNIRVPKPYPPLPSVRTALDLHWESTQEILLRHGNPASEWPVILGFVAHRTAKGATSVGPSLAARIIMEAAIIASKADPRSVQGATSGLALSSPAHWSGRALSPETQRAVVDEVYTYLPKRMPL